MVDHELLVVQLRLLPDVQLRLKKVELVLLRRKTVKEALLHLERQERPRSYAHLNVPALANAAIVVNGLQGRCSQISSELLYLRHEELCPF